MFKAELARNSTGYFLVIVGLLAIACGAHFQNGNIQMAMVDSGKGLVGAALLAFQIKRTPDGNTSTVQVTTPPPIDPPVPVVPGLDIQQH